MSTVRSSSLWMTRRTVITCVGVCVCVCVDDGVGAGVALSHAAAVVLVWAGEEG